MRRFLKVFVLLLIVCFLVTGCFNTKKKEEKKEVVKVITAEKISYSKVYEIISNYDKYITTDVVDVRSEDEFEEGHISGAMNIPYEDLDDIIIDMNREIIIYGDSSIKSKQAANELISLGYTNVKYIAGIKNWPYELEK